MHLRSQNTVATSHTYNRVKVECASNGFHNTTESCSNNMNEIDRMEEAMEYCTVNGGTDGSVETLHFDIDDRCDYQEFDCTKGEVIDAAEEFEYDFYGFMNWIDEYMDECNFENDHYNGIEVECDNRHYEDYLDHTNTTNATCDDYEQWMREAFLYCDENGSYIEDLDFNGYGCDENITPIESISALKKR